MTCLYIKNAAAISPLGGNLEEIWQNVLAGEVRFDKVSLPGQRAFFAAESKPCSASDITSYASLFGEAIHTLIADLGIEMPVDAIFFATAVGNLGEVESDIYAEHAVSAKKLDFTQSEMVFRKTPAMGPDTRYICVPTGCVAGLQAIGVAKQVMPKLGFKTAIIMSLDFGLTPLAFEAFYKINATCAFELELDCSPSRPFCMNRSGFLFADGGGAIFVTTEREENAPDPRISGYGCVSSAFHMTDIATDGTSIKVSIERALKDAQLEPSAIDHVNLHASGTQQNDEAEYNALIDIIGETLPTITAFKGNHGHALGGANMIETALTWKILRERVVPPTPMGLSVDAYPAVPPRANPEPFDGSTILKTASGFGGIHAAMIMEG